MMTDMINFCGYVAYYALGKSILYTIYMMFFGYKSRGGKIAVERLTKIAITSLVLWLGWNFVLTTTYAVWAVVIASVLCIRIAWREFKTIGGILSEDWNRCHGRFRLVDWLDWAGGFCEFIIEGWSVFNIFSIFNTRWRS